MNRVLNVHSLFVLVCLVVTTISPTAAVQAQAAPTFVVNNAADVGVISGALNNGVCETMPGNGVCTLRAAVIKANNYPGLGVTIVLPALPNGAAYQLSIPTASNSEDGRDGDLNLKGPLTIRGAGSESTIIDATGNGTRIFSVEQTGAVRIQGVTLRKGNPVPQPGGAILVDHSNLVLEDVRLTSNFSTSAGGAIYAAFADLEIRDSRIDDNHGVNGGGGVSAFNSTLSISDTVIENNLTGITEGGGVALYNSQPNSHIISSLIRGNRGGGGGGVALMNAGTLTIANSTIIGNQAQLSGGGIMMDTQQAGSMLVLRNVTVVDNEANQRNENHTGGGISNKSTAPLEIHNSIIARNARPNSAGTLLLPSDCAGSIISNGYNILSDVPAGECTVTGSYAPVYPMLALTLANHGGPTPTLALLPGSPAINAGNPAGCTSWDGAVLRVDQRGYPRPVVGCDLGAFEVARQVFLPLLRR